jgi:hypothetical protein
MPIVRVVTVRMMQADIDTQVDLMVLRIPPTSINNLVSIRRGVHRAIGDAIVHAVVTIVVHPITEAVRPISALPGIAYAGLWRRDPRRRRDRAIFSGLIAGECKHNVVIGVVGRGMIEDGFLGGRAWVGRVKERRDRLLRREGMFHRGAAHAEEESTEQESCQNILNGLRHSFSSRDSRLQTRGNGYQM